MMKMLFTLFVIFSLTYAQDFEVEKTAFDAVHNYAVYLGNIVPGRVSREYFADNSEATGYVDIGTGVIAETNTFALQIKFFEDPSNSVAVIFSTLDVENRKNSFNLFNKNGQLCVISGRNSEVCSSDASLLPGVWYTVYVSLERGIISVDGVELTTNSNGKFDFRTAKVSIILGAPQTDFKYSLSGAAFAIDNFRIYSSQIDSEQIIDEQSFGALHLRNLFIAFTFDGQGSNKFSSIIPKGSNAEEAGFGSCEINKIASFIVGAESFSFRENEKKRSIEESESIQTYTCSASGDPHLTSFKGKYYTYGANRVQRTILAASCPVRELNVWNSIKGYGWYWSITSAMTLQYRGMTVNIMARNHDQNSRNGYKVFYNWNSVGCGNWWNGITGLNSIRISYDYKSATVTTADFTLTVNFCDLYMNWALTFKGACAVPSSLPLGLCGDQGPNAGGDSCIYTEWSACSAQCNRGIRTRYLIAGTDGCTVVPCQYCNTQPCPCFYTPWSECNAKCNYGTQTRSILPGSGTNCARDWRGCTQSCVNRDCDCTYCPWSTCTFWCGGGTQRRLLARASGPLCPTSETRTCNTQECTCEYIDNNPPCEPVCGPDGVRRFRPRPRATCGPKTEPCPRPCDVDECQQQTDNCHALAKCTNIVCDSPSCFGRPTFKCECPKGYRGNGVTCTEIDECAEKIHNCHRAATCTNTPGSYICTCNDDWSGNGFQCTPLCDFTPWSKCQGFCDGIGKQYRGVRPGLVNEPLCKPQEIECDMPKCPEIGDRKCDFVDPNFEEQAVKACKECLDPIKDKKAYAACVDDVCFGDDLSIVYGHCDFKINDCLLKAFLNSWQDPYAIINPVCPDAPCICGGHGDCNKGINKCQCHDGWTGDRCQFKTSFPCMKLGIGKDFSNILDISSYRTLSDDGDIKNDGQLMEVFNTVAQQAKDSIIFYFARVMNSAKTGEESIHLFITNDDTERDTDGGSYSYKIEIDNSASLSLKKGKGGSHSGNAKSGSFSWKSNEERTAGAIISGESITSATITIEITNYKGINQVLVGSGTGSQLGTKFDLIPIAKTGNSFKFQFKVQQCNDICSQHGYNCFACAEDPSCGYCRDTNTCVLGNAAGPIRGECKDYRYTFDEGISRRLTVELGFPVDYTDMDVWLSAQPASPNYELPVKFSISQDDPTSIAWDVLFMPPKADPNFNNGINRVMSDIVESLRDFNQPRLGIASWGNGGVTLLKTITSVWQRIGDFQAATARLPCVPYECVYRSPLDALATVGAGCVYPGWRNNARRAVIIAVNMYFASSEYSEPNWSDKISKIVKGNFYPVFVTKNSLCGTYEALVKKMGFGMVLPFYTRFSTAIARATDQITLVVQTQGHLNLEKLPIQSVSGLNAGQRARFDYILHKDKGQLVESKLISPGFGSVKIEAIKSDIPTCQSNTLCVREDQIDSKLGVRAIVMQFKGKTYGDYPIVFYIVEGPSTGELYQYDQGKVGRKIDWLTPTFITDPQSRLIYIAPEYAQSWPFSPMTPYAVISWASSDLCTRSATCTTSINIFPVPTNPLAPTFNVTVYEDQPQPFHMNDKAFDPDRKMDGSYEKTSWALSKNPSNILRERIDEGNYKHVPCNTFSNLDPVYIVTPKDKNGVFRASYYAKDETGRVGKPGDFFINVIPVNDPPTINVAVPITTKMETWSPITIVARDIDSTEFFVQVILEETMKGQLKYDKTKEIVPKADTTFFSSGKGRAENPRDFSAKFLYKPERLEYSCDLMNPSNNKTACDPTTDIYTWFMARAVDKEGLKSALVNVSIIVMRVEVPPQTPEEEMACTVKQNGEKECKFFGEDVNPVPAPLTSYISQFPTGVTIYQYPKTDGLVPTEGPNKGLITDPQGRVIVVANPGVAGKPTTTPVFLVSSLSYQLTNGKAFSDSKEVSLVIQPVNQPPVPLTKSISATEEIPLFVNLDATDPDNSKDELTFTLTRIPDISAGSFYRYDASKKSTIGELITEVPFVIKVQECKAQNVSLGACVWFIGAADVCTTSDTGRAKRVLSGPITFEYSVKDTPRYQDLLPENNIGFEVKQEVDVIIFAVNDAPVAISSSKINQDRISIVVLGNKDAEGDAVRCFLTKNPSQGRVFLFNQAAVDSNSTEGLTEIFGTPNGLEILDEQCRILYQPPYLKNSDSPNKLFRYSPIFGFFVEEKNPATPPTLRSNVLDTPLKIEGVVYPPLVWQPTWTEPEESDICYKNCQFKEDFEVFFPQTSGVRPIYLGGWDVQHLQISAIVEDIDCGKKTNFYFEDGVTALGSLPQQVTGSIETSSGPALKALLYFEPSQDANNYQCHITYRLINSANVKSVNSYTVSFTVLPVNDAPRVGQIVNSNDNNTTPFANSNRVIVPENTEVSVTTKVHDVEDDSISVKVAQCSNNRGTFTIVNGEETTTIDCEALEKGDPSKFVPVKIVDNQFVFSYKPPVDANGDDFNSLTLQLDDGKLNGTSYVTLPVDLKALNNAPTIYAGAQPQPGMPVQGLTYQEISIADGSALVNKSVSLFEYFHVEDIDAGEERIIDLVISFTAGDVIFGKTDEFERDLVREFDVVRYAGTQKQINTLVNTMTWLTTETVQDGTVTIVVSDRGYSGFCLRDGAYVPCVLNATVVAHVSSGYEGGITNVGAIAGPVAAVAATAAAAAGLAAVGLLAGASQSTAASSIAPAFDSAFEGIAHVSEIHEVSSVGGTSGIFQGAM